VSGTLSHYSSTYFLSGSAELGESGWWKLAANLEPELLMQQREFSLCYCPCTSTLDEWTMLMGFMAHVPAQRLAILTDIFIVFPSLSRQIPGYCCKLSYTCFLPHRVLFILQQSELLRESP
jgi:hypothetical protein